MGAMSEIFSGALKENQCEASLTAHGGSDLFYLSAASHHFFSSMWLVGVA
jgi:hypothetical protein